ncbi:MAG: hypothetical protein EXQ95_02930 [Alphaproteobacteria bacterium]|nr:hypothetical protein [Alphaproteobacteria bacterium]
MGMFAAWLGVVVIGMAVAQQPAPVRPQAPPIPPPSAAECSRLPGGNAPVNKIAELLQPLSPRSLDLTYFNKRLADLTDDDFERIAELATKCNRTQARVATEKARRLRDVVRESQTVRHQALDKVDQGKSSLAKAQTSREKVEWLHNAWADLPLLSDTITKTDLREYAAWIARSLQAVYDVAPGYGKRPPPTVADVLAAVPQRIDQITPISRETPDTKGPLPARPWWALKREREDE